MFGRLSDIRSGILSASYPKPETGWQARDGEAILADTHSLPIRMKHFNQFLILAATLLLLPISPLNAQNCDNPIAQVDLAVNGVRARLTTGGDLWWDGQDGRYEVTADPGSPNVNPVSAIFAGGLWIGGLDPGGSIKMAAQKYGRSQGNFDYYPGPLTHEGITTGDDCANWDRFFPAIQSEIRLFRQLFDPANPDLSLIPENIAGWPGAGNPLFASIHGFSLPASEYGYAPFWDTNLDGIYDPRDGDYPLICGDEAYWCVFNDTGNVHRESLTPAKVQAEIHLLAYAFASSDSILHRTTFYDYTIINRSVETVNDFYAGHWIDSDLGCYNNDQVGSSSEKNLFYVYNQDGIDPAFCEGGVPSYGNTAPVNIFQVVNASVETNQPIFYPLMSSVVNIYRPDLNPPAAGTTPPRFAQEYYNVLKGLWPDGTPITRGGTGYQTSNDSTHFVFDGVEVDGAPWIQCNVPSGIADIRQAYSTGPYVLDPGGAVKFTLAITTIFGVGHPGGCPDTDLIFAAADHIKDIYDNNCADPVLTDTENPLSPSSIGLETFPNPTSGELTFRLPAERRISSIEVLDITGRLQQRFSGGTHMETINLDLSAGIYLYRLTTMRGEMVAGRVVVR